MATKKLAKKLGLLKQRSKSCSESKKPVISDQIFSYLIVIDFESTCWREKTNYPQEIIEFPAVLLNTSTGEVESEFHTYVQPQEHPVLSEFCTELTGITQMQVEAGIPLQICLSQFNRWLQNLQLKQGVTFPNNQQTCSASSSSQKLCTFLTWSVCLQYECKRKQLHKPEVLNSWIDLRSTYRLFYNRKPKGLNGALQDLGIQFSGREHSGLDDARNTAQLAVRMMRDGCVMVITRSLERNPVMVKPKFGNHVHPAENKKDTLNIHGRQNVLSPHELTSSKIPLRDFKKPSSPEAFPTDLDIKENSSSVQSCKSLISPKTLLSVTAAPPWGQTCGSDTARPAARPSSTVTVNSSHVLCSTTISCFSNPPQSKQVLQTDLLDEEEDAGLLVETEDRCGSYDNMVLECDDAIRDLDAEYVSDFDSGSYEREESDYLHPSEGNVGLDLRGSVRTRNNHRIQNITSDSLIACKSINTVKSISNGFSYKVEMMQQSTASSSAACFAVPKAVNWSKLKQRQITSPQLQPNLGGNHKNDQTIMTPPIRSKSFFPEKTSTPNTSPARLQPFITKHTEPQKSSFNIFTEMKNQTTESFHHSSSGSGRIPNNILSSLSANTSTSRVNPSRVSWPLKGLQKITSPLCACGRRSKRQVVSNGGPNHGRGFFCCPVRRSGGRGTVQKGCDFFKWESVLMKNSAVAACAERSSISICQNNSALHHKGPPRKSYSSVGDAATVIRL